MKQCVPFLPPPQEGESIQGFLLRLAEGNAYPKTHWLKSVPDLPGYIGQFLGIRLFGPLPSWIKNYVPTCKNPEVIRRPFLLFREVRYCPRCLADDYYYRFEWQHSLYTVCHIHQIVLLDSCWDCGKSVSWNHFRKCTCGSCLEEHPSTIAQLGEVEISRQISVILWKEIYKFHGSGPPKAMPLGPYDALIGDYGIQNFSKLIDILGRHASGLSMQRMNKLANFKNIKVARQIVSAAARLLSDWPMNLYQFFLDYGTYNEAVPGQYRKPRSFNALINELHWNLNFREEPNLVTSVVTNFLAKHESYVLKQHHIGFIEEQKEYKEYLPLHVAAQKMGISIRQFENFISKGIISSSIKQKEREENFVLVHRDSLAVVESHLSDRISRRRAGEILGISEGHIYQLLECGFIEAAKTRNGPSNLNVFSRRKLNEFLASFAWHTDNNENHDKNNSISVDVINNFYLSYTREFEDLMRALVSRDLMVIGQDESLNGISGFLLRKDDFLSWKERQPFYGDDITVEEAAERLSIEEEVTYHLVRKGLIPSNVEMKGRKKCRLLNPMNIESFKMKYVAAEELAVVWKISPNNVVEKLLEQDIMPITGPTLDGCKQYFFAKNLLESIRQIEGNGE